MEAPTQIPYQQPSPAPQVPYVPQQKSGRGLKIILFVLIFGIAVVFGILYFLGRREAAHSPEQTAPVVVEVDLFPDDRDRDGIEDTLEEEIGTNDADFDTDGDGLSDSAEINDWKTDPKNPDTDGDGFADGYEVIRGFDPKGDGEAELIEAVPE